MHNTVFQGWLLSWMSKWITVIYYDEIQTLVTINLSRTCGTPLSIVLESEATCNNIRLDGRSRWCIGVCVQIIISTNNNFLVPLWVFRIIISTLVNVVNKCFRIITSRVILSKLIVFLPLEHVLMEQIWQMCAMYSDVMQRLTITCIYLVFPQESNIVKN